MRFYVWWRKRGRELTTGETERERMSERQSIWREGGSISIGINTQWKCNMMSRMKGVDKEIVSVDQNDTSVFLVGDI
jgi:hypothetical protein